MRAQHQRTNEILFDLVSLFEAEREVSKELAQRRARLGGSQIAAVLETAVSPIVGRVSDRRGRLFPCLLGLAAASGLMLLFPLPDMAWQLILLVLLAAPTIGMLWAPSMAMLSDGAEAVGIAQGFAFAMSNLGWSIGQTTGSALSAKVADVTSDAVPYLILSVLAGAALVALVRLRATSPTLA